MRWNVNDKSALSFGMGYHSQTQPLYTRYYIPEGNNIAVNQNLDLTYSKHIVLGTPINSTKTLVSSRSILPRLNRYTY